MSKLIEGFTHHTIDEYGTVINTKTNNTKAHWIGANGYYHVDIQEFGKSTKVSLHRLLARTFIPNIENKRTVNHIDGNKLNNNLSNLEWATDSENMQHAHNTGLQPYQRKYSLEDYERLLINEFLKGKTITEISKTIDQSLTQLSLHLREAAIRLGIESQYNSALVDQKQKRAKEKGMSTRHSIILQMIDLTTNEVLNTFSSITEAKNYLQVKSCGPIANVIANRQKTAYGYFWVKL